jgi:serine/threonine protein kinase
MGSCNFKSESLDTAQSICKSHFQFHYGIGKGGFGKVWKVELKKSKDNFAMKEMSKARILAKKSVNSVINERKLLSYLKHPFIVNMQYAFQDRENLYLVMDLMPGGDFRFHLSRCKTFTEDQTRFFVACVLLGLEFLHNNGVIHRDIKPENLVFDAKGYLTITDFGIARLWVAENAKDTSGTPGYMAPEVMCRQNHGVAVDYFALGVIVYEIMMGTRPYLGRNRKDIRDQILAKQVQIRKDEIPAGWSTEAGDFVNHMIQRKPVNRLGLNGPDEVKKHPWLKDMNWERLRQKTLPAPFVPAQDENFDDRINLDNDPWKDAESDAIKESSLLLNNNSTQEMFSGYIYDISQSNSNTEATSKLKTN